MGISLKKIKVDPVLCKRCGICIALCPKQVFEAEAGGEPQVKRPGSCIGCKLCELRCPDFAVKVED